MSLVQEAFKLEQDNFIKMRGEQSKPSAKRSFGEQLKQANRGSGKM